MSPVVPRYNTPMSESGFPQFPSTPKLPERTERFGGNEEPRARITRLPRDLADIRAVAKIRGEVIERRLDARTQEHIVRVRTDRGEVEVRLPPEQHPPERGAQVELEIQPNRDPARPPEQAIVRPVEERHAERPPTVQPERQATTPVNVEVGTQPSPRVTLDPPQVQTDAAPRTGPITGDIIRLIPLSPQDAKDILQPPLPEIITESVIEPAVFKAQVIVQNVQINAELIPSPLGERVRVRGALVGALENPLTPTLSPGGEGAVFATSYAETKSLTATQIKLALPPIKNLTPEQIFNPKPVQTNLSLVAPKLEALQLKILHPALITGPATEPQTPPPAQFIDAKIEKITQAQVQLIDPKNIQKIVKAETPETKPLILHDQKPGTLTGIITGATAENLPVLGLFLPQTGEVQNFAIQTAAEALPPGTQLQITPQAHAAISTGAAAALPPFSYYLTPEAWPMMEDLYQTLARSAPATAQAFSNILPNPANPAQLTPAALFFIAAVRGGELNGWLGEKALDALRRDGKGGLLSRITQEGGLLSRLGAEPVSQDWRAVTLPMFHEGEIQKIALYYKHGHESGGDQQQGKQTRFIFDLKLDNMGKVQLDGLFRPGRLDLALRTETPFSQPVQADMRQTYAAALRQMQVTGELSFQNNAEQWVTIQVDDEEHFGVEA